MTKHKKFRDILKNKIIVADGGITTSLQKKNLSINESPLPLNITDQKKVEAVHKEFIKAGSSLITTNTFGADKINLAKCGQENKTELINKNAVRIAKESILGRQGVFIGGSIGPISEKAILKEQAEILIRNNVDAIVFETFFNLKNLLMAIKIVRDISNIPIIAMMSFSKITDAKPEKFSKVLNDFNVDAIGINCGEGIEKNIEIIKKISKYSKHPLIFRPNAGIPKIVKNKPLYNKRIFLSNNSIKTLVDIGVKIFGGCCGITPRFIHDITIKLKRVTNLYEN